MDIVNLNNTDALTVTIKETVINVSGLLILRLNLVNGEYSESNSKRQRWLL